jgi:LmbE family N-acetylglucosaminyl deacetylase
MSGMDDLGTILGVWSHPDDEAWLSAGIMAEAVRAGRRVVCVTATRGELGTVDPVRWPVEGLAEVRTAEMERCLELLGVTEHLWLDYPDGGCADVAPEEAIGKLVSLMEEIRPDTVLSFGPDGMTGHTDHQTTCAWATEAFRRVGAPGARLLYATKTPEFIELWLPYLPPDVMMDPNAQIPSTPASELAIDVDLRDDLLALKMTALRAQASQITPLLEEFDEDVFRAFCRWEFFRLAA